MALLLFGVSVLGTCPATPQDPVTLELTRSLSRGDSSAESRETVADLCSY